MARRSGPRVSSRARTGEGLGLGRLLIYAIALCSAGAGVIHIRAVGEHTDHRLMVAGFLVFAAFQLGYAGLLLTRPSRRLVGAGALATLSIILIWVTSRATGIGFISGAEARQPIEAADLAATVLEAGVVAVAALYLLLPNEALQVRLGEPSGRRALTAVGVVVALLLVPGLAVPHDHSSHDHDDLHGHTLAAGHEDADHQGDQDHAHAQDGRPPAVASHGVIPSGPSTAHRHDHAGVAAGAQQGPVPAHQHTDQTHGTQPSADHPQHEHSAAHDHGAEASHGAHADHGQDGHHVSQTDFTGVDPNTYATSDHPAYGYDAGPRRADNYVFDELFGCHVDHPYMAWLVDTVKHRLENEFPTIVHALLNGFMPMSPVPNDFGYPDTYWHWWNLSVGPTNDDRDEIVQPHNWIEYLLMVPSYWPETGEDPTDLWTVRGVMFASPVPDEQGPELYPGCNPFHNHTDETDGLVNHDHFHMWPWHHAHPMAMNPAHLCDDRGESVPPVYPNFFRELSGDWDCTHANRAHGDDHDH